MPFMAQNAQPVRASAKPSLTGIDGMPVTALITVPTQGITEMDTRLSVGAPDAGRQVR